MTIAWATVTGLFVETECWTGYNFTPYYWILEGPRMAIIAVRMTINVKYIKKNERYILLSIFK